MKSKTESFSPPNAVHSSVHGYLKELITQQGFITFAEYMRVCLYTPGLGYYSAGSEKFGAAGDFVTAPEISPLFSWCLARQCQSILQTLGQEAVIFEFGAGSGALAIELLQYLKLQNSLPAHYYILEVSAELRDRQQTRLRTALPWYIDKMIWLDAMPESITGIILANEVLDAMPVTRFCLNEEGLQESVVGLDKDQFVWQLQAADDRLSSMVHALEIDFPRPYCSEINLYLPGWIHSVADCLTQGVCLILDYGFPAHEFYHPQRSEGTLMCHYQHRAHPDPFLHPGLQDITAHVDFTAIALQAVEAGLQVAGYTNQAAFLMNLGITDFVSSGNPEELFEYQQQVKRLTLPSEMGELFKVIALTKNFDEALQGFSRFDQRMRLAMKFSNN